MRENRYRNVIFDLDGTIADSMPGMLASLRHTFGRLGISGTDASVFERFIGPPLADSFRDVFNLDGAESERAVRVYREHYALHGIPDSRAYPGIAEMLAGLSRKKLRLFVASAKLETYAAGLVHHLGLGEYFEAVCGSTPDAAGNSKAGIIRNLLNTKPGILPSETIMVGDMDLDVFGARANGIPVIAVLYGYGKRADILGSRPEYTADTVDELSSLLEKMTAPRS